MFIILPVAGDHILTWMPSGFLIKQTSQRLPEEKWTGWEGGIPKLVLAEIALKRTSEEELTQGMW